MTSGFTIKDFDQFIRDSARAARLRIENYIIYLFQRVGEQFVIDARNTRTYKDHTGNLRNSIGYAILRNGEVVSFVHTPIAAGHLNDKDITAGDLSKIEPAMQAVQNLIFTVAKEYKASFTLFCFAGMEYAAAVESRGFDVITHSSMQAKETLVQSFNKILQTKK
jgi:hypothetical protein